MDNTKPDAQHQPLSDTGMTSDSTSQQQQPDILPAPLQTSGLSETRSRSRTGSSSRRPEEAEPSAVSSSGHERMPSVNSLPPREGLFGLVSSSGQLVCEFRPTAAGEEAPNPPPKVPEGTLGYITSASFATITNSQSNLRAPSPSPPPQQQPYSASPPLSSPSAGGPTASTLELAIDYNSYPEAVDRNSYPEVYIPDQISETEPPAPSLPPRHSSPSMIPRKSLPMMDNPNSSDFSHPSSPPLVSSSSPTPAPAYSTPADYQRIGYAGTLDMSTAVATVTPLHMLGDQPDTVDCPFCMRRVETRVKKRASSRTHTWGAILFFTTLFGVAAPYCCDWYVNVEHHCKNCARKVAQKRFDGDGMEALGTRPEHRQVSCYMPAEKPGKKKRRSRS